METQQVQVVGEEAEAVTEETVDELGVAKTEITEDWVSFTTSTVGTDGIDYTGAELQPGITVATPSTGDVTLNEGTDYSLVYSNNVNAGTASVKVVFDKEGDYKGNNSITKNFTINAASLSSPSADATIKSITISPAQNQSFAYDGTVKKPSATVSVKFTTDGKAVDLVEGIDFTIIPDSTKTNAAGDCISVSDEQYAYIKGIGNYKDTNATKIPFAITAKTFDSAHIDVKVESVVSGATTQEPKITVIDKESKKVLVEGTDYAAYPLLSNIPDVDVTPTWPANVGSHDVRIFVLEDRGYTTDFTKDDSSSINKDTAYIDASYSVVTKSLETAAVEMYSEYTNSVSNTPLTYNATTGMYEMTYNAEGQLPAKILLEGCDENDYVVTMPELKKCVNVGTYEATITGRNNLSGSRTVKFAIVPAVIDPVGNADTDSVKAVLCTSAYAGAAGSSTNAVVNITKEFSTKVTLAEGKDYEYTTDLSKKSVSVTGKGNYTTPNNKPIEVYYTEDATHRFLGDSTITGQVTGTYAYNNGIAVEPAESSIVVMDGTRQLKAGVDFDYAFENNTEVGTARVVLTGKGGYVGTDTFPSEKVLTFEITGSAVETKYKLKLENKDFDKTVDANKQTPKFLDATTGKDLTAAVGANYSIKYYRDGKITADFVTPGVITVEVTDVPNYSGTLTGSYEIYGIMMETLATVPAKLADQVYTGAEIKPTITLTPKDTKDVFVEGKDYTVTYKNNVKVGEAIVIIEGIGNYRGQLVTTFDITAKTLKGAKVTTTQASYTFTGKEQKPEVTVTDAEGNAVAATDYTVEYKDNKNAGTATVTVTGAGNYTDSAEGTFTITKATFAATTSKVKAVQNAAAVAMPISGAVTDVTYTSSSKAVSVAADGKISFNHVGVANVTATVADADNYDVSKVTVKVVVMPKTPAIKVGVNTGKFRVKASVDEVTGYQIVYVGNGASKKVNVNTTDDLNKLITGLKAGSYKVKVRAYNKADGASVYGYFSAVKKITVK